MTTPIERYATYSDSVLHPIERVDPGDIAAVVVFADDAEDHERAAVAAARAEERAKFAAHVEGVFKNAHQLMSDGCYSYCVPDVEDFLAIIEPNTSQAVKS